MSAPLVKPAKRVPAARKRIQRTTRIARSSGPIPRRKRVNQRSRHAEQRRIDDAEWSRAVRDAAGGRCERCEGVGTAGHHVFGKKAHPKLRYVLANGCWLCHEDHRGGPESAHSKPVQFKAWFAAHRPEAWRELQDRLGRTTSTSNPGDEDFRAPMKGRAE